MELAAALPVWARTAARSTTPRWVTLSLNGGRQKVSLVGGVDGVAGRGAGLSSTIASTGVGPSGVAGCALDGVGAKGVAAAG